MKSKHQKRKPRKDSRAFMRVILAVFSDSFRQFIADQMMKERSRARSDLLCPSCAQFGNPHAKSRKCALCGEPK